VDYPITVEPDGVKIKSEKMDIDKLYYCIYNEKILLFFKEQNEMLNCYEITEKDVVEEVKQSQTQEIENILLRFIEKNNLKP
jgi:hypothetical protein